MSVEDVIGAIINNDTPKFIELINSGIDMNQSVKDGHSPLTYAVESQNYYYAEMLLTVGKADVNFRKWNGLGHTPLYTAVSCGYESIALMLVRNGASVESELGGIKQFRLREDFKRIGKMAAGADLSI